MATTKEHLGITIDLAKDSLLSDFALATLKDRYLLDTEDSYQEALARCISAFTRDNPELGQRLYDYASKLWWIPSTPVLSNGGTEKGLPISCFLNYVPDSRQGFNDHFAENTWLASMGGGIGGFWGAMRSDGTATSGGSCSTGSIPFIKTIDSQVLAVKQGNTRRAAYAAYQDISHPEIEEFLLMRRPTGGDPNRKCLNLHHGVVISDAFMRAVELGEDWPLVDPKSGKVTKTVSARKLWEDILILRVETGEPYLMFADTVNKAVPECHKQLGLYIKQSNLCCVTGDQRVATEKGLVTVSRLHEEHQGLSLVGYKPEYSKVLSNASPMYLQSESEPVFEIVTKEGYSHKVTKEHKVWLKDKGWVETKDLVPGDKLQLQPGEGNFGTTEMPYLAFIVGLHTADGTSSKQSVCLDIWEGKTLGMKEDIESMVKAIIMAEDYESFATTSVRDPKFSAAKDGSKARLSSAPLKHILENYGYAKNVVPEFVWQGSRDTVEAYLSGIYVADGHIQCQTKAKTVGVSLASTNYKFLQSVQLLWLNLGVKTSIYGLGKGGLRSLPDGKGGRKEYLCKPTFRLVIGSREGCRIADKATRLSTYRINSQVAKDFQEAIYNQGELFRNPQNFTATVTEVRYVGDEAVYCPEVYSDNHSWVANGFVTHNSEIVLPTSETRTAVCCLSSVNLEHYELWSKTSMVQDLVEFLDNVLQYFIDTAPATMAKAIYSASRERSLGLGSMGFHSFLQSKGVPMESAMAESWNRKIFSYIRSEAEAATWSLGFNKGSAPDFEETMGEREGGVLDYRRNVYLMAIAPNASSGIIANTSPSIEPLTANVFTHKTDSGSFQVRNKWLEKLLSLKVSAVTDIGTAEAELAAIWKSILEHEGSVQHLDILSDQEKLVFKTAFELDQSWLVHHATVRQQWIDQAQSVNLFFASDVTKAELHKVHWQAWTKGLKTLYYCRSRAATRADNLGTKVERAAIVLTEDMVTQDECLSCSG